MRSRLQLSLPPSNTASFTPPSFPLHIFLALDPPLLQLFFSLGGTETPPPHHCPLRTGRGTETKAAGGGGGRDGIRKILKVVWTDNGDGYALQLTQTDPHHDGL